MNICPSCKKGELQTLNKIYDSNRREPLFTTSRFVEDTPKPKNTNTCSGGSLIKNNEVYAECTECGYRVPI